MTKVAIVGASGFTGAELMRICAEHPSFEVAAVTGDSMAGKAVADLYPSLAAAYPEEKFITYEQAVTAEYDLAFCALPHGAAQSMAEELAQSATRLVDLSADFRFDGPSVYSQWYGEDHAAPELLERFVFGLPELYRCNIREAELIASPGCYVTAASLALAPLVAAGAVEPTGIIVDAASGVSGAGRAAKPHTTFCSIEENFTAYGLLRHRHTPEIEMAIAQHAGIGNVQVLFTPHLAPMNRGILATCYARPTSSAGSASTDVLADTAQMSITDTGSTSAGSASTDASSSTSADTEEMLGLLREAYADEPFVVVDERLPSTKATLGSNSVHITARVDDRTGWVVVIAALDNLGKGASGQAVQCANLSLGIDEATGLAKAGVYP